MKYLSLTLLFVFTSIFMMAQNASPADTLPEAAVYPADTTSEDFYPGKRALLPYQPDKKISVRMEMGTGFGFGAGSANTFGAYIAPHISYKVSPRLRVNFGTVIQNSNYINYYNPYNPYYPEYTQTFNSNITRTLLYAEGQYLVNPRLMVNAKVYKEIATFGDNQINPRALDLDGEGMSVGFNYKINDNMHIGAEFGISKGSNPYHNPFYQPGSRPFGNPYGIQRNPFFDQNSEW